MQDLPFVPALPDKLPDTMVSGDRNVSLKPRWFWKSLEHRPNEPIATGSVTMQHGCNSAVNNDDTDKLGEKENAAPSFLSPGLTTPPTRFSLRPKMQTMAAVAEEMVRDSEEVETVHIGSDLLKRAWDSSNTCSTSCVDSSSSSPGTPVSVLYLPPIGQVANPPPRILQAKFIPHSVLLPDLF